MPSLEQIFAKHRKETPYSLPIVAKVCGKSDVTTYRSEGQIKHSQIIGLSDSTMAVRGILYDCDISSKFEVGKVVFMLNTIIKPDSATVVITKRSKVRHGSLPIAVPELLCRQAYAIACPPPAAVVDMKTVKTSPVKTLVSIKGQVIAEEMERTVVVKGEETRIKSIKVKDATGQCKVTLWRNMLEKDTSVGSHISLSNVLVQLYNEEKSLSTTTKSIIETTAIPEHKITRNIVAYTVTDENVIMLTTEDDEDFPEYTVSNAMLQDALGMDQDDDLIEVMDRKIPLMSDLVIKEKEVVAINIP